MKRIITLFTIFCSLTVCNTYSQNKFIEVLVKDTICLKPLQWEYQVFTGLKYEYNYENPNSNWKQVFSKKLRESEEKLALLVEKLGFDIKLNQNPEANIKIDLTDKRNYLVTLKSLSERERFKNRMREEGYQFYMTNVKFENKENKIKEIYKRLLMKARERAKLIAQLSDKKLDEIINISESKSEFALLSSFIEGFKYSQSKGFTSTSFQFNTGVLEKSLIVKYSIK